MIQSILPAHATGTDARTTQVPIRRTGISQHSHDRQSAETKAVAVMPATTLLAAPGIVIVPDGMGAHMVGNHSGGAPLIHW